MNREIKFRVFDKKNKVMYVPHKKYPKYVINQKSGSQVLFGEFIGDKGVELMQYTGLKDKNGKEIYEGDICEYVHYPNDVVVFTFDEKLLTFKATVVSDGIFCEDLFLIKTDYIKLKNVGNIYENPDLVSK